MNEGTGVSEHTWLADYFERYRASLFGADVRSSLLHIKALLCAAQAAGHKVIIAGNGGSAAIASHVAVDLSKNAAIRCVSFDDATLITCLANDYGYERWLEKALEAYADDGDVVILISSSGRSPNMLNAARFARARGLPIVTLTGFAQDNPLGMMGMLNLWVDSRAYNIVEMTHQIWLLAVCDLIIGAAEYPANREATYADSGA